MHSKWRWLLNQLTRALWVRASLFALLAIVTALIAIPAQRFLPEDLAFSVGADSVGSILNILASSMLAVTTFSLSVMVSAYASASSGVTPRATKLVKQDTTTQNVLATFIGSFLFSLVGIIALSTDMYGDNGRLILFVVTLGIVVLIVVTMLRWIEHLSMLGRVGETSYRVETAAHEALLERIEYPCLGARPLTDSNQPNYRENAVFQTDTGYVQHIDIGHLNRCAESHEGEITVLTEPGQFVHVAEPIACFSGELTDELKQSITRAFTIGLERSFDQDPRFGLSVMAEIASRALSPAVNDPGTAIDILGRSVRVLAEWNAYPAAYGEQILYPHVQMKELALADLFDDIFVPISRDGAGLIEVQVRLQKSLLALKKINPALFGEQVNLHSEHAYQRATFALNLDSDLTRLAQLKQRVQHNSN